MWSCIPSRLFDISWNVIALINSKCPYEKNTKGQNYNILQQTLRNSAALSPVAHSVHLSLCWDLSEPSWQEQSTLGHSSTALFRSSHSHINHAGCVVPSPPCCPVVPAVFGTALLLITQCHCWLGLVNSGPAPADQIQGHACSIHSHTARLSSVVGIHCCTGFKRKAHLRPCQICTYFLWSCSISCNRLEMS